MITSFLLLYRLQASIPLNIYHQRCAEMPKTMTRFESEATLYEAKMTWTVGRIREMIKRKETLGSPAFSCKIDPNKAVWSLQLDFGNAAEEHLSFTASAKKKR